MVNGRPNIAGNGKAIGTVACVAPAAGNCAYRVLSEVTDFSVMELAILLQYFSIQLFLMKLLFIALSKPARRSQ